jgi:hypothetical protein
MVEQHFVNEDYLFNDYDQISGLNIAIQNATEDEEAPALLQEYLVELGYPRPYVVQEPFTKTLSTTRLIAQKGDSYNTDQIKAKLNLGESFVESTGDLNSDITIVLGKDWLSHPQIKKLKANKN